MRLWHKDLLFVLPRQQLLGQWRECCAIAKNIAEKGTPNHVLVNKIMDYPICHFASYARIVSDEMKNRGYKLTDKAVNDFIYNLGLAGEKIDDFNFNSEIDRSLIFPKWHDYRYLRQCYYNLQEKYDCKAITQEEWEKIENHMV